MLRREEEAYLDKWLACGASKRNFEDLRKLYLEEFSIRQTAGRGEAEMAEKRAALDIKLNKLWGDVKRELHAHLGEPILHAAGVDLHEG